MLWESCSEDNEIALLFKEHLFDRNNRNLKNKKSSHSFLFTDNVSMKQN